MNISSSASDGTFYNSKFSSVKIGNGVETIGNNAFNNCRNLTSITIPNSVTEIRYGAFQNCSGLTSVTIPNRVTFIGGSAFSGCSRLTDVTCKATFITTTASNAFNNSPLSSATLHVPAESVEAYSATSPWSGFGNIVALADILRGDANGDGKVDMDDATFVTNIILGTEEATEAADVNNDGAVSMPDAMFIVNKILNGKFPDEK